MTFLYAVSAQTKDLPSSEMVKQNREIVRLASEELSKTLPQDVDKYTKLMAVEGKDTTMVYIFEINTGAKSDETVRKEDRTRMQKAVTKGICKRNKRFMDAEISISYVYRSAASKETLFQFDVNKTDCEQLKRD